MTTEQDYRRQVIYWTFIGITILDQEVSIFDVWYGQNDYQKHTEYMYCDYLQTIT